MKLLFVTLARSIHTTRWVKQLAGLGWDIHLFDPLHGLLNPELPSLTYHTGWRKADVPDPVTVTYRWPFLRGRQFIQQYAPALWQRIVPPSDEMLAKLITQLQPDCIHSMGIRNTSLYLVQARQRLGGALPAPWVYSSWGSDIYYYRHTPKYLKQINDTLSGCDYYIADCERDIRLAREHGFEGSVLPIFPTGGGFPIDKMRSRLLTRTSDRKIIAVKGLQHFAGRALDVLNALETDVACWANYEVVIFHSHPIVRDAVAQMQAKQLPIRVLPGGPIEDVWELLGQARVSIGAAVSDGTPNTMLEAMIMGAFPIQSNPGGVTAEWIDDGRNGLIMHTLDSQHIMNLLREALANDALVDQAAESNLTLMRERVNREDLTHQARKMYRDIVA